MSSFKGVISALLLVINTLFWGIPLMALALLKLMTPTRHLRRYVLAALHHVALAWMRTNNVWIRHWIHPQIQCELPPSLSPQQWWLVIANHRSWTDIMVLLYVLAGQVSIPKFFLKRELIFIPVIGLAWWALEFPFLRRYSRETLARRPDLAKRDKDATERMCRHAREMPMTIFSFVEGTRFTPAKHQASSSPYRHLLKPKAGGIFQVIGLLGDRLDGVLDVTLHYRRMSPSFWDFLCGRESDIAVTVQRIQAPKRQQTTSEDETQDRERFYTWLNSLWQDKDQAISSYSWS